MTAPRTAANGAAPSASTTSPVLLALAWAIVGVPAAWGLLQTVVKSLALFR